MSKANEVFVKQAQAQEEIKLPLLMNKFEILWLVSFIDR